MGLSGYIWLCWQFRCSSASLFSRVSHRQGVSALMHPLGSAHALQPAAAAAWG